MMINKRLIGTVSESKKYIAGNVLCQWVSLVANIVMMVNITVYLAKLFEKTAATKHFIVTLLIAVAAVAVRYICTTMSSKMSYLSSKTV
ncbi:MAG: cysteine ABC transporter ATP-binding protein, partial [Lachnospiraceae bacterium]